MTINSRTKFSPYFIAIMALVLTFSLSSCGQLVKSMAVKRATVSRGAIPPEFGKEKTVLLCMITGKNSYDKYMKKHVTAQYHGEYEFVLPKDLEAENYKDVSKYRYVFDRDKSSYSRYTPQKASGQTTYTTSSYFIFDRKTNKTYEFSMTSSFYAKIIQGYMIGLEKERLK